MNENRLTEGSNMRWESSRMMLPEHKQALYNHKQKSRLRERPVLDEQQKEMIGRCLQQSKEYKAEIELTVFDPLEDRQLRGVVERITVNEVCIAGEYVELIDVLDVQEPY